MKVPFLSKKSVPAEFEMPYGMAVLMGKVSGLFMGGGDKLKTFFGLVTDFATAKNVAIAAAGIIDGINELQKSMGKRLVLTMESTTDNTDLVITIYTRTEDLTGLEMFKTIHLSQVTQQDITSLTQIIQNATHGTNDTGTAQ